MNQIFAFLLKELPILSKKGSKNIIKAFWN